MLLGKFTDVTNLELVDFTELSGDEWDFIGIAHQDSLVNGRLGFLELLGHLSHAIRKATQDLNARACRYYHRSRQRRNWVDLNSRREYEIMISPLTINMAEAYEEIIHVSFRATGGGNRAGTRPPPPFFREGGGGKGEGRAVATPVAG